MRFRLRKTKGGVDPGAEIVPILRGDTQWQFRTPLGGQIFIQLEELAEFVEVIGDLPAEGRALDLARDLGMVEQPVPQDPPVPDKPPVPDDPSEPEEPSGGNDPFVDKLLVPFLQEGVCPSCCFRYDSIRILMWASKVEKDGLLLGVSKIIQQRGIELFDELPTDDPLRLEVEREGALWIEQNPLKFETVEIAYKQIGNQKIDAHNIIGQNAVKTEENQLHTGGGTFSIIHDFYFENHKCNDKYTCSWMKDKRQVEILLGDGGVMSDVYCQKKRGGQCKNCESAQGEWHLLQRCNFFLEHPDTCPLEFIGLQWCAAFLKLGKPIDRVDLPKVRLALLNDLKGFHAFLTEMTKLQIDRAFVALDKLCGGRLGKVSATTVKSDTISGPTETTLKAISTGCPVVMDLLSEMPFEIYYKDKFLSICNAKPHHPIKLDVVVRSFQDLAGRVPRALVLYDNREARPREEVVVPLYGAGIALAAIVRDMVKEVSSMPQSKDLVKRGKVSVNGNVYNKDGTKLQDCGGPNGDGVFVIVVTMKNAAPAFTIRRKD